MLLQQNKLIPLSTFFNVSNHALHQNGNHSRSIFYAQAWALIHYLVQNGKGGGLGKFLSATSAGKPAEQAFQDAFGFGYAQMEKELRKYVSQNTYVVNVLTFKNKLTFDTEMQAAPLTEADSNAYLGDLLYHTHRWDDAEPYLRTALSMNPSSSMGEHESRHGQDPTAQIRRSEGIPRKGDRAGPEESPRVLLVCTFVKS
jgi:hypothetical protein